MGMPGGYGAQPPCCIIIGAPAGRQATSAKQLKFKQIIWPTYMRLKVYKPCNILLATMV